MNVTEQVVGQAGYVFQNRSFGFIRFPEGLTGRWERNMPRIPGNMEFVGKDLDRATIFGSVTEALDALQQYPRRTDGNWCSNLELYTVESTQVITTAKTASRVLA